MAHSHKAYFPDLGEFRFIDSLLANQLERPNPDPMGALAVGVGDDCAQLDRWLVSTDMSVEGTHFRLDWSSVPELVEKCVLSNLSDINAMGGVTYYASLGLCLNRSWGEQVRAQIADAFAQSFARHGVTLLGGDTVAGAVGCFSVTVFGLLPQGGRPLLRSGARPGDFLYVSGHLGGSAAGLDILLRETRSPDWTDLVGRYHVPQVPLGLGAKLQGLGLVHCCIDLSDGLSSELHHLALQSSVRITVHEAQIPLHPSLAAYCNSRELDQMPFWMDGGEEYQLIFTSPLEPSLLVLAVYPFDIQCIGQVGEGCGVELVRASGVREELQPKAWSHL